MAALEPPDDLEFPLNLGPCAKPLAQVDVARVHLSTGLPDVRARHEYYQPSRGSFFQA